MPPRKRKRRTGPVNQPTDSPDLISALPDEVLASVLSLLPLKESVRTSILSSRWRHLWSLSSLELDDSSLLERPSGLRYDCPASFEKYETRSREIVSRIISTHIGPIHSCSFCMFEKTESFPMLDGCIETLAQRGIEELNLRFYEKLYKLPTSIAFCKSLSKLSLKECCFLDPPFPSNCFQNLKDLQLRSFKLSEETLRCIFTLSLESLELFDCTGASIIRVSSLTLRKLLLKSVCGGRVQRIIIEDAPNLKQLMLGETMTLGESFIVQHAPNLKLLGLVALEVKLLQLGSSSFRRQESRRISANRTMRMPILINISSMLPSIKTLAIRVMFNDRDMKTVLPAFLRCFPCLESLDLLLVGRLPAR